MEAADAARKALAVLEAKEDLVWAAEAKSLVAELDAEVAATR